jgi:hypothetical protein
MSLKKMTPKKINIDELMKSSGERFGPSGARNGSMI